ncbi:hypothetical protein [Cystobacter fuscus]|uniref:hypothetical protein n=1 Tax=Cystobacter fuscus TaxID=43 RepID=UPI001E29F236|nr:hypothetical protein [Cystobacter fuscus]
MRARNGSPVEVAVLQLHGRLGVGLAGAAVAQHHAEDALGAGEHTIHHQGLAGFRLLRGIVKQGRLLLRVDGQRHEQHEREEDGAGA